MPGIFEYLDHRSYLKDWCRQSGISLRELSRRAGFKSDSYLSLVLSDRRKLSATNMLRLARILRLKKAERDCFMALVNFGQARDHEERRYYLESLLTSCALNPGPESKILERDKYEFYTKWYLPVILELIRLSEGDITPTEIGKLCIPAVDRQSGQQAVEILLKLGLVEEDDSGRLTCRDTVLSTGDPVGAVAVRNFQEKMIDLGREALDRFTKEDRDISTVTVSVDREAFGRMKEITAAYRKQLLSIAAGTGKPTRVVQINVQLFPVSAETESSDDEIR